MIAVRNASRGTNTVFTVLCVLLFGLMCHANEAMAQMIEFMQPGEVADVPTITPRIYLATAEKKSDKTMVRVSIPTTRLKRKNQRQNDDRDYVRVWKEAEPVELGKQIRAYLPSGEKMDDAALLKALAKPTAVACFLRMYKKAPEQPDPFYTSVLHKDMVILVWDSQEYHPE